MNTPSKPTNDETNDTFHSMAKNNSLKIVRTVTRHIQEVVSPTAGGHRYQYQSLNKTLKRERTLAPPAGGHESRWFILALTATNGPACVVGYLVDH